MRLNCDNNLEENKLAKVYIGNLEFQSVEEYLLTPFSAFAAPLSLFIDRARYAEDIPGFIGGQNGQSSGANSPKIELGAGAKNG